jgi:hypothetical protein
MKFLIMDLSVNDKKQSLHLRIELQNWLDDNKKPANGQKSIIQLSKIMLYIRME